jgi:hypothetical protein
MIRYQIANVNVNKLPPVTIKNQERIIELTGSKLDLIYAYDIIRKEANDFTEDNEKAVQADAMYMELLKTHGVAVKESTERERIQVRERERLRALALIELELSLLDKYKKKFKK